MNIHCTLGCRQGHMRLVSLSPVTSTRQDASISESLKHELNQKFVQKKKKIPCAKIWAPVQRNVVLEACMVAANAVWHVVFQRLLEHLLHFQD